MSPSPRLCGRSDRPGRMNPPPIQPFKQGREPRRREADYAVLYVWPAELTLLQPLGQEANAGSIPVNKLDPVGALCTEHIDRAIEGIGLHRFAHESRKPPPPRPCGSRPASLSPIRTAPEGVIMTPISVWSIKSALPPTRTQV
jgi:hypothetical protein